MFHPTHLSTLRDSFAKPQKTSVRCGFTISNKKNHPNFQCFQSEFAKNLCLGRWIQRMLRRKTAGIRCVVCHLWLGILWYPVGHFMGLGFSDELG
jgi:hypothetical protein